MSNIIVNEMTEDINVIGRREAFWEQEDVFSISNKAWISGVIEEEFVFSHEAWSEKYYKTQVKVVRLSGIEDHIPIILTESLMNDIPKGSQIGKYVEIGGYIRSVYKMDNNRNRHLRVFLFAKIINIYECEEELEQPNANYIYLEGRISRDVLYIPDFYGKKMSEFMLKVPRIGTNFETIPCIVWGKKAKSSSKLKNGDRIFLYGRIQSRQYLKKSLTEPEQEESKTVYEVFIKNMKKIEN